MKKTIFFSVIMVFVLCLGFTLSVPIQAAPSTEHQITIGDDDSNTNNLPYGDTNHDQDNARIIYPDRPTRMEPNTPQNPRNINNRNYNTTNNNDRVNFTRTATTNDHNRNYGWIGWFGLLGLLGLFRRERKS